MKAVHSASLLAVAFALLVVSVSAHASQIDDRIEASARESYIFQTYLKDDDITIRSNDGAVTLTGFVTEESHKTMARETVVGLPGVTSVDNRLEVMGAAPTADSDAWLRDKVEAALMFHRSVDAAKAACLPDESTFGGWRLHREKAPTVGRVIDGGYGADHGITGFRAGKD